MVVLGVVDRLLDSVAGELRRQGADEREIGRFRSRIREEYDAASVPVIAMMGFTGVGKSSTINALFDAGRPVGEVLPCTKAPDAVHTQVKDWRGSKGPITVYDMPGLGEDVSLDDEYMREYVRLIPEVDCVVWIIDSGNRAMAPVQQALAALQRQLGEGVVDKFVVAVNKFDAIAPGEPAWRQEVNMPSAEQQANMESFKAHVEQAVRRVTPRWKGRVVPYSARRRFRLGDLLEAMVEACPKDRMWALEQRADLADFAELIDPRYLEYVKGVLDGGK